MRRVEVGSSVGAEAVTAQFKTLSPANLQYDFTLNIAEIHSQPGQALLNFQNYFYQC